MRFVLKTLFALVACVIIGIAWNTEQEYQARTAREKTAVPSGAYQEELFEVRRHFFGGANPTLPRNHDVAWNRERTEEFWESLRELDEAVAAIHKELGDEPLDIAGWLEAYQEEVRAHGLFNDADPHLELRTFLAANPHVQAQWDSLIDAEKRTAVRDILMRGANKFQSAEHYFHELETHTKVNGDQEEENLQNCIDARDMAKLKLKRQYGFTVSEKELENLARLHGDPNRQLPETSYRLTDEERAEKMKPTFQKYLFEFLTCFEKYPEEMRTDVESGEFKKIYGLYLVISELATQERLIRVAKEKKK